MIWRAIFLIAGFAVIGVEAWGTFDFLYADQHAINYIVVGGCLITVLSGILPAAASKAWADWRPILAIVAWLLVPLSLGVVFMATISRTGGAADRAQGERVQAVRAYNAAQKTVSDLEKTLSRQQSTADFECAPAQKGRGVKCSDAEKAIADTQEKLTAARGELVKAPAEPVDSLSMRISAITGGRITQDQARMFQPAILPIIMSLVGAVLVAIGAHKPKPAKPAREKPAEVKAPAAQPPPSALEPVAVRAPEPPRQVAPPPKARNVVRLRAVASVPQFIAECVEPAPGASLPLAELHAAYVRWADSRNATAEAPEVFISTVQTFAKRAGVPILLSNGQPHCDGVRLSA